MPGIRIGWYVAGDAATASVRLRCLVPLKRLVAQGHLACVWQDNKNGKFDVVIFSKIYDDGALQTAQRLRTRGTRIILDLCDNHWFGAEDHSAVAARTVRLERMLQVVDRVTASTPLLAQQITSRFGLEKAKISVIPDPVLPVQPAALSLKGRWDMGRLKRFLCDHPQAYHLVWFGNHGAGHARSGMEDLERIRHIIDVSEELFSLTVISNSASKYQEIFKDWRLPVRYIPWRIDTIDAMLTMHDCAVIPITPNPFTLAKTMNRPATALMAGLEVFADRIPSYDELSPFITLDSWTELGKSKLEKKAGQKRIEAGQNYLLEHYSSTRVAAYWLDAIDAAFASPIG
jgi:hypothetical protein